MGKHTKEWTQGGVFTSVEYHYVVFHILGSIYLCIHNHSRLVHCIMVLVWGVPFKAVAICCYLCNLGGSKRILTASNDDCVLSIYFPLLLRSLGISFSY